MFGLGKSLLVALMCLLALTKLARGEARVPEDETHRTVVGAEVFASFATAGGDGRSFADDLSGYGYGALMSTGFALWGGYELMPFIDAGLAVAAWSRDEGTAEGGGAHMQTDAQQLGAFLRLKMRDPSRRLELASRIEGGGLKAKTALRGHRLEGRSLYWRVRMEWAAGSSRTKAVAHFSYQAELGVDGFAPYGSPRLGGIAVGLGVLHRF